MKTSTDLRYNRICMLMASILTLCEIMYYTTVLTSVCQNLEKYTCRRPLLKKNIFAQTCAGKLEFTQFSSLALGSVQIQKTILQLVECRTSMCLMYFWICLRSASRLLFACRTTICSSLREISGSDQAGHPKSCCHRFSGAHVAAK